MITNVEADGVTSLVTKGLPAGDQLPDAPRSVEAFPVHVFVAAKSSCEANKQKLKKSTCFFINEGMVGD